MIPVEIERRARWVLDTIGASELGFGDDVPYDERAWAELASGRRPEGDEPAAALAGAFFDLARVEELDGRRDEHGRFLAAYSSLDPLDPPLERLRRKLGVEPRRWGGARFAVALSSDVDVPWRWTRRAALGAAARLKGAVLKGRGRAAYREARALAAIPLHKLRGSDPYWCFERVTGELKRRGAGSTFFVMAGHGRAEDGPTPELYDRLRPKLVQTLQDGGAEVGLHGSYTAADDPAQLALETERLRDLAGQVSGHRFHYLRLDPQRNLGPIEQLGFSYDCSLGFPTGPASGPVSRSRFAPGTSKPSEPST